MTALYQSDVLIASIIATRSESDASFAFNAGSATMQSIALRGASGFGVRIISPLRI